MQTVNRPTALGLSILLHGGLLLAGFIAWPFAAQRPPVHITPVTLMTAAEIAPLREAEEAPEPQQAQVEKPEPAPAKAQPPPKPTPPAPKPPAPLPPPKPAKPEPAPKPVAKAVAPAKPTKPEPKPLNLNDLARTLAAAAPPSPPLRPVAAAPKGPTQAEKDAMARQAEGEARAAAANALTAIGNKIADNWNLSCASAEDRSIVVRLRIDLGVNGGLINVKPDKYDRVEDIADPKVRAAAIGAVSAARAAAPFTGLPPESYSEWRTHLYTFPASELCAERTRGR